MVKIAVCDDDIETCRKMKDYLIQYSRKSNMPINIQMFCSGNNFVEVLRKESNFDVVFLDIEMDGLSGIEIGKIIREELENERIKIVYISAKEEYAMELFEVRPFHFLIKPIGRDKVFSVLEKVVTLRIKEQKIFQYKVNKNVYNLLLSDILYFASNGRKIQIQTKESGREFYGKLSCIETAVGPGFLRIHKSYLVNREHVAYFSYEAVRLVNGITLNITRNYRTKVREIILKED